MKRLLIAVALVIGALGVAAGSYADPLPIRQLVRRDVSGDPENPHGTVPLGHGVASATQVTAAGPVQAASVPSSPDRCGHETASEKPSNGTDLDLFLLRLARLFRRLLWTVP